MKTNRKHFSLSLCFEGIRQTKLIGIIFLILFFLQLFLSLALPSMTLLNDKSFSPETYFPKAVNGFDIAPAFLLTFTIASPLLVLFLFRFLNRRNAADFYHSLPHPRTCIYFSFLGSAIFWILLFALETVLTTFILCGIFSQFFTLLTGSFLTYVLANIVASVAVACGVSLAMSITGTTFSNLIMSAMLLFVPRMLLLFITAAVTDALPILASGQLSPLLGQDINLITGVVFYVLFGNILPHTLSAENVLLSYPSILYTALLSLAYLVLGAVFFARRKSETAQRNAPTKKMQAIYRILLTFSYFAVCTAILFSTILYSTPDTLSLIWISLFGFFLFYLYELLTTKSFKKTFSATPSLLIVFLLVALFFGTLCGITELELHYTPKANEVKSVTLLKDNYRDSDYLEFPDYAQLCSPEIKFTDENLIRLICENLEEQTILLREDGYQAFQERYQRGYFYESYGSALYPVLDHSLVGSEYTALDIKIQTALGTRVRTVRFTHEELTRLTAAMEQDNAYTEIWTTLPEPLGKLSLSGVHLSQRISDDNALKNILQSAQKEIREIGFENWYTACKTQAYDFNLQYTVAEGAAQGKTLSLAIDSSVLPKTAKLCKQIEFDIMQEEAAALRELLNTYYALNKNEQAEWFIHTSLEFGEQNTTGGALYSDNIKVVEFALENLRTEPRSSEDDFYPYAHVTIETRNYKTNAVPGEIDYKYGIEQTLFCRLLLKESTSFTDYLKLAENE